MTLAVFDLGKPLAFSVVDYSDAIPARFANESDCTYWTGYLAGESQRFAQGFCNAERFARIVANYAAALNRSN
jgi:hypothetical protein